MVSFGGGSGLARPAPYTIRHGGEEKKLIINQTTKPTIAGIWFPLGQFEFGKEVSSGDPAAPIQVEIHLTDKKANGNVVADAVQFVHVDNLGKGDHLGTSPLAKEIKVLEEKIKKLKTNTPKAPEAMAAMDNTKKETMGDLHIRIRGEPKNLGVKVPRGFLQIAPVAGMESPDIPEDESGRLQLAAWISHPDHPLTARVMANRIWQQLFGQGIVITSDNFGTLGGKALPSGTPRLPSRAISRTRAGQ